MTQDQKIKLLEEVPSPPQNDEDAIVGATVATLVLFPNCENWEREGDFVYDPETDEAIYLPLGDIRMTEERAITKPKE